MTAAPVYYRALLKGWPGAVQVPMLGKFRYMGKPDKQHTAPVKCIIHMFVMQVAEELQVWPEMAQRQRFWVSIFHHHRPSLVEPNLS